MTEITIDIDTPFPSPDSIRDPIMEAAVGCPNLTLPELPTLPSPVFPTLYMPSLQGMMASAEIAISASLSSMAAIFQQFTNIPIIGSFAASFFPTLPIINLPTIDLMFGNVNTPDILAIIKENIPDISLAYDFITLPWYPSYDIPDLSTLNIWQTISSQAMSIIMKSIGAFTDFIFQVAGIFGDTIEDLINQFAGAWAPIKALLASLPPTFDQIMFSIKDLFDLVGDTAMEIYASLLASVQQKILTLKEVMAAVSQFFIGLPVVSLPDPLIPDLTPPSFDIREALKNLYVSFPQYVMDQVWSFLDGFLDIVFNLGLPSISLSFPLSCDQLTSGLPGPPSVPSVPSLPV